MKDIVRSLSSKGFMHIFSASLINKIVSFGTSFIVVRILSKEAYGAWAYAMNILNFFLLVEGLGVVPGLLQYASLSNTRNEKTSFLKLAFLIGLVSNLIVAIGILLFTCYFELPIKGSAEILRMLSFFPVISIMVNIFQVFLRADFRHKSFSYLTVFNTVVFMICVIVGGLLYEVKGMVFGKYISVILSIFISIFILRDYLTLLKAKLPDLHIIKEFLVFSLISVFN
ncbi:MAG TPA: oligosaccharide flippase family protein, partial [Thermotogota bacterium]|nr:oligosaccharide flippase family protein [Thermotogota bacterium]